MKATDVYLESGFNVESAINEMYIKNPFNNVEKGIEIKRITAVDYSETLDSATTTITPIDINTIELLTTDYFSNTISVDDNYITKIDDVNLLVFLTMQLESTGNFVDAVQLQYKNPDDENWITFGSRTYAMQHDGGSVGRLSNHLALFDISGPYQYRLVHELRNYSAENNKQVSIKNQRMYIFGIPKGKYM